MRNCYIYFNQNRLYILPYSPNRWSDHVIAVRVLRRSHVRFTLKKLYTIFLYSISANDISLLK